MHTDMIIVAPMPETPHNIVFQQKDAPFDGVVKFESIPKRFFEYVLIETEKLLTDNEENPLHTAWNLVIQEYVKLFLLGSMELESALTDNQLRHFIHYKTGYPPYFSKKIFGSLQATDPHTCLLSFNPNFCTDYIHQVIRSYRS